MKIHNNVESKLCTFDAIPIGEVFMCNNNFFIKGSNIKGFVCALDLATGIEYPFRLDTVVKLKENAVLTID